MFINPKVAIEKGWITYITDPVKQVQPNAIDFTLDAVQTVGLAHEIPFVGEHKKQMRTLQELPLSISPDNLPFWPLRGQAVYDGTSGTFVELPEGVAAVLFTRSTFARNGVLIASGLYDSGYKGHVGFTIYTHGGNINIYKGTRIGQIAFIHSENAGLYTGGYNHQQGSHYAQERANVARGQPSSLNVPPQSQPTLMEAPIGANPGPKSDLAQKLEETNQWNSEQGGKPAGTKNFI